MTTLLNLDPSQVPDDGDGLVYDAASKKWLPGPPGTPTAFELRGTGMPNGVITANPGTYYTDTAGTNGAWRWLKKTGTGNTGWSVVHGDTGLRRLDETDFQAPFNVSGTQGYVRRIGPDIQYTLLLYTTSTLNAGNYAFPAVAYLWGLGANQFSSLTYGPVWNSNTGAYLGACNGSNLIFPASVAAGVPIRASGVQTPSAPPWPTTLPGTAQ